MIYGYARVSTDSQDLGNQVAQPKAAGSEKIYRDEITDIRVEANGYPVGRRRGAIHCAASRFALSGNPNRRISSGAKG
jgi:DNA invertase Pin-like site-specific DNA recombinase